MDNFHVRDIARGRKQVVAQCGRERLAGVVITHELQQCIANAVRHTALDLAVDDQRVDDAAAIMRHAITHDHDPAGLRIDFDFNNMRAVGISGLGWLERMFRVESRLETLRHRDAGHPVGNTTKLGQAFV